LDIASANVSLTPDDVQVKDVAASLAGSEWRGSLALPRQCGAPGGRCLVRFDLHADTISTEDWDNLLTAHPRKGPWYRLFASNPQPGNSYLLALHAAGQLTAKRLLVHKLSASRVSATVELENGILHLSNLMGDVLGGSHHGEWKADFTARPPEYSGSGSFQNVDLKQLSQAMHDGWITGTGTASYRVNAAGLTEAELMASANGSLQMDELEGTLPHVVLNNEMGPLRIRSFAGRVLLQSGKFQITASKLEAPEGDYQVSGTASLGGILNLKFMHTHARGFTVVGPLDDPTIVQSAAAEARAALKP
jgi:hypothetical protein